MNTQPKVEISLKVNIVIELDEVEARALHGIFGYNVDQFLNVFYERMGRHYVQPFEAGVRSLHGRIRGLVAGPLSKVDEARKKLA